MMRKEPLMIFSGRHFLLIGIVFWTSVACVPKMPQKIDEVRNYNATFVCDGTRMVIVNFTPFAAALESDGVSADLTQQPATDEFFYTGGGQSLRARGNEATWIDNNGAAHQCRERLAEIRKSGLLSR
jgi:hypothetical protein